MPELKSIWPIPRRHHPVLEVPQPTGKIKAKNSGLLNYGKNANFVKKKTTKIFWNYKEWQAPLSWNTSCNTFSATFAVIIEKAFLPK